MKKIIFLVFLVSLSNLTSQSSIDCNSNLSIFAEYYKVKNYEAAYEPWMSVRKECPKINPAIYFQGSRMLDEFIKKSEGETKNAYQKDLLKLYDEWLINFPAYNGRSIVGQIMSNKAQKMIDYKLASKSEIFTLFEDAYQTDPLSFDDPKPLYSYFKTYFELYKDGENDITLNQIFNKYEELSERYNSIIDDYSKQIDIIINKENSGIALTSREKRNKRVYEINSNASNIYLRNLNAIIAKESTCENLIPLYRKNLEENKTNPVWLNRAASRMDSKECSDDPLFVVLVELLHNLDKKNNSEEALKFYNESIELETDNIKKARILYKIAAKFKNTKQFFKSRNYARRALEFQPSMGRAHLLIANLYASSANGCGKTQFEKRSVYWLAEREARKAASIDATIRKTALKAAESYLGRAPSKTDIFTEGNSGKVITFNCWIGLSVTVPTL